MSVKTTIHGRAVENLIVERKDFHAGGQAYGNYNFRGDKADMVSLYWSCGRLPEEFVTKLTDAKRDGNLTFVVWSYGTPIAWHDTVNGWTVPDVKYSRSTTSHQSTVRSAVAGV